MVDAATFVYHKDCPKGKIVSRNEAKRLYTQGWVDHPNKIGQAVVVEEIEEKPLPIKIEMEEEAPRPRKLRRRRK